MHTLLDAPVALAAFYPDSWTPRIPSIAVAAGSFVFVYRNLRPYMKFTLPQVRRFCCIGPLLLLTAASAAKTRT